MRPVKEERVLELDHCPALDAAGHQCRRAKGHGDDLLHYAKGSTWRGDYTEARREHFADEPLVIDPAPADFFMAWVNPFWPHS